MNARAGSRIVWRGQTYDVIVVRPSAVTLRDQDGGEFDVSHDELNRAAEPPATDLPEQRRRSSKERSQRASFWCGERPLLESLLPPRHMVSNVKRSRRK